jgi:hypothetical protein
MEHSSTFKYDLKTGQVGEGYISSMLSNNSIEVKTDFQAMNTGNVFVEYSCSGKPSGLSKTEADWFAFIISNERILFIKTTELKKICRCYINTPRDIVGGDNNLSKGILVPLYVIAYYMEAI